MSPVEPVSCLPFVYMNLIVAPAVKFCVEINSAGKDNTFLINFSYQSGSTDECKQFEEDLVRTRAVKWLVNNNSNCSEVR